MRLVEKFICGNNTIMYTYKSKKFRYVVAHEAFLRYVRSAFTNNYNNTIALPSCSHIEVKEIYYVVDEQNVTINKMNFNFQKNY